MNNIQLQVETEEESSRSEESLLSNRPSAFKSFQVVSQKIASQLIVFIGAKVNVSQLQEFKYNCTSLCSYVPVDATQDQVEVAIVYQKIY